VAGALAGNGMRSPLVLPGGSKGGETTAYCLVAFLASNGATVLSEDRIVLDSPETAQTLEFMRSLIDDGLVPADVVAYEWTQPVHLLAAGRAALSVGGSYEARYLSEAFGVPIAELLDHVGFVPVPAGPAGHPASVAGSMSYAIFRQAAQPQLAMNVLKSAVAPPVLAGLARSTGRFPGRRSAVDLAAPHVPFVSESAQLLRHAVTRPKIPLYPRVSTQLQAMLEAALTARLEPEAAASRAAEHIEAITGLPVLRSTIQEALTIY
jgi:multiple sugar transport system substrate-binding protein